MINRSEVMKELNYVKRRLWDLNEESSKLMERLHELHENWFKDIIDTTILHKVGTYINDNLSVINGKLDELPPIESELNLHVEDLEEYLANSLFLQICEECDYEPRVHTTLPKLCGGLFESIDPIIKVIPSSSGYEILPDYKIVDEEEFNSYVNQLKNHIQLI